VQNNQISDDEVKFFFRQVVQGIGYAHANLIAHRDLKPENILIDAARVVKVVDFGLSNLMKDGRLLKTACGSPNYAAPEIVSEQKYEGTSVDVWSCGVILYALLVGHLPFSEERVSLLYRKIEGKPYRYSAGSYSIPESVNPLAADLIRRMLQVDPYKRIRLY
jgi:5'-AMP-activated protein kinase, catalytic alpha subunit